MYHQEEWPLLSFHDWWRIVHIIVHIMYIGPYKNVHWFRGGTTNYRKLIFSVITNYNWFCETKSAQLKFHLLEKKVVMKMLEVLICTETVYFLYHVTTSWNHNHKNNYQTTQYAAVEKSTQFRISKFQAYPDYIDFFYIANFIRFCFWNEINCVQLIKSVRVKNNKKC